jgi:hypothetical protein
LKAEDSIRPAQPAGEAQLATTRPSEPMAIDTLGGRVHIEWDPQAPVTPLGQLGFFVQGLKTADLFEPWVADCPLRSSSPKAPSQTDILGPSLLSALAGPKR